MHVVLRMSSRKVPISSSLNMIFLCLLHLGTLFIQLLPCPRWWQESVPNLARHSHWKRVAARSSPSRPQRHLTNSGPGPSWPPVHSVASRNGGHQERPGPASPRTPYLPTTQVPTTQATAQRQASKCRGTASPLLGPHLKDQMTNNKYGFNWCRTTGQCH